MNHMDHHSEHKHWQSEHSFWLDELKLWKSEHRAALSVSKDLDQAVSRIQQELDDLEHRIFDHESQIAMHEGVIADGAKPGSGVDASGAGMTALHEREVSVHAMQGAAFDRVRRRHQEFMKSLRLIERIVDRLGD